MALDDEIEIDRRLLPRLIEHAESIGDWSRANDLRERMGLPTREPEFADGTDEAVCDEAFYAPDDTPRAGEYAIALASEPAVIQCLPFADRVKRRLQDYGVFEVDDLAPWTYRLLRSMLRPAEVQAVRHRLAAIGAGSVIGSGQKLLTSLPPKSTMAVDVRHGNLPGDLMAIIADVADGKLTQRKASQLLGSNDQEVHYGRPHQRFGSAVDRNSEQAAPLFVAAIEREYGRCEWFVDATVTRISGARRRCWGVAVTVRCSRSEAVAAMRLSPVQPNKGRGKADGSWRSISVIFGEPTNE